MATPAQHNGWKRIGMALIALTVLLRIVNPSVGLHRQMAEFSLAADQDATLTSPSGSHVPLWALLQGALPCVPTVRFHLLPPRESASALAHGLGLDRLIADAPAFAPLRI